MLRGVIQYVRSPETTHKELGEALRLANSTVVETWYKDYMPSHFTVAGGRKYSYQKRAGEDESNLIYSPNGRLIKNPKYYWAKWRKYHTHEPLVKTGASREAAKNFRVDATRNRGTGSFPAMPRYFWMYRDNAPHKGEELVTTTQDEIQSFVPIHEVTVTRYLDSIRTVTTFTA